MAITKSARKAIRQSKRRRVRNIQKKDTIKNLVKQMKTFVSQEKNDEAKNLLPQLYKALDKATKSNVIKKNTASRRKSRLTKLVLKKK